MSLKELKTVNITFKTRQTTDASPCHRATPVYVHACQNIGLGGPGYPEATFHRNLRRC